LYARRAYNLNMKPETKTSFTENIRAADASLANVAERRGRRATSLLVVGSWSESANSRSRRGSVTSQDPRELVRERERA